MAVFNDRPKDALSVWSKLDKHLLFVWLWVSSIKTGTRRIIRLDELPFVLSLELRKTEDHSSRWIKRFVPVLILETHNQTNNKFQTHNASSSIKAVNMVNAFNGLNSKFLGD